MGRRTLPMTPMLFRMRSPPLSRLWERERAEDGQELLGNSSLYIITRGSGFHALRGNRYLSDALRRAGIAERRGHSAFPDAGAWERGPFLCCCTRE